MKDPSNSRAAMLPRRLSPVLRVLAVATTALTIAGAGIGSSPVSASSSPSPATTSGPQAPTVLAQAAAPSDEELPPNANALMRTPRFRGLAAELRCLVCQNQNLLDSHSPLAADLRHEVVRLMDRGMDDGQIKQYLVDRYGEFVLYRPTWSWRNALLWAGPALMLMIGGFMLWRVFARRPVSAAASGTGFGSGHGHSAGRDPDRKTGTDSTTPNVGSGASSRPGSVSRPNSDSDAVSAGSGQAPEMALSEAEALARVDALLAEDDNAQQARP